MKIAGIICEYNPFHNGHAWQIEQARNAGATHVICLMSGDFVQRGSPALFPRHVRAKAALLCGADLVLQLPLPYAMARAERFAYGAVSILDRLGCVDVLHFGSECGDIGLLLEAAHVVMDPAVLSAAKEQMDLGKAFAPARTLAVEQLYGPRVSSLLQNPNDTLGIEYLKWILRLKSPIQPQTIPRHQVGHEQMQAKGGFASATFLRQNIKSSGDLLPLLPYVPRQAAGVYLEAEQSGHVFRREEAVDAAVLFSLRGKSLQELEQTADMGDGLHHRIFQKVRDARSYSDLLRLLACKRYPNARLRRILLSACLGITEKEAHRPPPYAKILGFGPRGLEILRAIRPYPGFSVRSKSADIRRLSPECARLVAWEDRAQGLYALGLAFPAHAKGEFLTNPVILR